MNEFQYEASYDLHYFDISNVSKTECSVNAFADSLHLSEVEFFNMADTQRLDFTRDTFMTAGNRIFYPPTRGVANDVLMMRVVI